MVAFKILLSPPELGATEREMMLAAYDSGWVAPAGPDLEAFESECSGLLAGRFVVGLSSGTAGLHLSLMVCGVGSGDDVLVSSLTFGAPAFAATYVGARPCFIDCDPATWQIDVDLLEEELTRRARAGSQAKALIVVDLYGSTPDLARIERLCAEYGVALIEDAAEAIGASYNGRPAGTFGDLGVISFNGNKLVTTGGGGAIVTADRRVADRVRHLATQARLPAPGYLHDEVGYNYRLGNINAAIGRGQLRSLPERLKNRALVQQKYRTGLATCTGIRFQAVLPQCRSNHWLTTIDVDAAAFGASAEDVLRVLQNAGIEARPGFRPMNLQPVFRDNPRVGGAVAARLFDRGVSLPSSGNLSTDDVTLICSLLADLAR
jgi:dTDP-4-amino-4,6-dideoxygalactose transaminase